MILSAACGKLYKKKEGFSDYEARSNDFYYLKRENDNMEG